MSTIDYLHASDIRDFIHAALQEDVRTGDHSSLASIPETAYDKARLIVKEAGIIAGVEMAEMIFHMVDPGLEMKRFIQDGTVVKKGDFVFEVQGKARSILTAERLVLNCMQRMSGIATLTNEYVKQTAGTKAKVLDTRKTTPNFRRMEKWAVKIGGGSNHRFGLYDMIILKDNHVDFAGGIGMAIESTAAYLKKNNLTLKIEIETRNLKEVQQVLEKGMVDRIMLDNMDIETMKEAVLMIGSKYETEASGGVNLQNIRNIALTGVDFISVGALTHSAKSIDLSLKAFN